MTNGKLTSGTTRKRAQISHFIATKLLVETAVQGVVVVGSVAAGTARENSDIDSVIFLDPHDLYIVPAESIWCEADDSFHSIFEDNADLHENGLQLEVKRLDWQKWRDPAHEWPEPMCAELVKGWVAFDRNGEVAQLIASRCQYSESTRLARLDEAILRLDQLLTGDRPQRVWETLGMAVAHDRLQAAYEHLVQALFATNRTWRTWRDREMTSLLQLQWLPDNFQTHLLTALNAPAHDLDGYAARVQSLRYLYGEILTLLINEGVYGNEPINEAFIRNFEEPGRAWNMQAWNEKHRARSDSL